MCWWDGSGSECHVGGMGIRRDWEGGFYFGVGGGVEGGTGKGRKGERVLEDNWIKCKKIREGGGRERRWEIWGDWGEPKIGIGAVGW